MNTSYKKCDVKPWNIPDKEAQEQMIKKIEDMQKEVENGEAEILFCDAVHQLHNTINGYAVQFKWKKHTKVLASNTWRKRFTIVWAVNKRNCKTSFVTTDLICNKELMKSMIDTIVADYKDEIEWGKIIYIILDNARYQKAIEVQQYAKDKWITLQFLPPYCPHLNIIERLRKRLKKKLRNQYIPLFQTFCSYIIDIMSSTKKHIDELKTLLTYNFGII